MTTTTKNKQTVWDFWQQLSQSRDIDVVRRYAHRDMTWHGPHPINDLRGVEDLISGFWQPLLLAFPDLRRETDIFMGGRFEDGDWVCGTGHFIGNFKEPWLGIPPTGRETHIRFGEFSRVEDGLIVQTYIILDLIEVMQQAGFRVLPPNPGRTYKVPGPAAEDGMLLTKQNEDASRQSQELVDAMIGGLMLYDGQNLSSMNMPAYWHADKMHWYGPTGIGHSHNLKEFEDFHQRPFLTAFPNRKGSDQNLFFADGLYAAAAGFPSVVANHHGEYLGCPPTGNAIDMRVMDFWRRDGNLLLENWVLIDIIDVFRQFGIDLFKRLEEQVIEQ